MPDQQQAKQSAGFSYFHLSCYTIYAQRNVRKTNMTYDELVKFIQGHFTDGLVLVLGSGLSAAEGIPDMPALATYLSEQAIELTGADKAAWLNIKTVLDTGEGLEAALLRHAPSSTLEAWIVRKTCELLMPIERKIMSAMFRGDTTLRLSKFLSKILKPTEGLPILTTNYDRLIEIACEMEGFHVDTAAVGNYAGTFDHERSLMGSSKRIATRGKTPFLEHYPRAVVLKPHGSFDWYRSGDSARRCGFDLVGVERLIITPGTNKYKAGYEAPFDKHRDLANSYIDKAAKLFVVGYGFNDDHLQTHLIKKINDGLPTLILSRSENPKIQKLAKEALRCVALSKLNTGTGVSVTTKDTHFEHPGDDLWDLGVLTKELL
ncbi:MAG: SIR2 family protein [Patescibacteria group bacterium]